MVSSGNPFLQCVKCKRTYSLEDTVWKCECGGLLDVKGTDMFPRQKLKERPSSFWRYREALALPDSNSFISLGEVMTPVLSIDYKGWNISVKLESLLPTGSYKDRGIAVCVNHAVNQGIKRISEDSSGNAGASTAAYAAAAGIQADIFVPEYTSPAKIRQIEIYGARCHLVPGNRTDCSVKAQEMQKQSYYIGHSWNPLFACGIKSLAYEIAEQCDWNVPDWVVIPAGGGSIVMGLINGFKELIEAEYIKKLPRLLVIQATACAPIYKAWKNNSTIVTGVELQQTCAEGIALPNPARGTQTLLALRNFGGAMESVTEAEIISAWHSIAEKGIFIEPTSAATLAGAWKFRNRSGSIKPDNKVMVILTGHGLKTKIML